MIFSGFRGKNLHICIRLNYVCKKLELRMKDLESYIHVFECNYVR